MKKVILIVMLGVVMHAQAGQAHREVTERAASLNLQKNDDQSSKEETKE